MDLQHENNKAFLEIMARKANAIRKPNGIGRTRIKLAKIVSDCLGVICKPDDLQPAKGSWRSNKTLDGYAWEVFAETHTGIPFVAGCWETMTECVKAGKVYLSDGEIFTGKKSAISPKN